MANAYSLVRYNVDHYDIVCNKCGIEKHEEEFYKCAGTRVGRQYTCIECWSTKDKSGKSFDQLEGDERQLLTEMFTAMGYDINENIHGQFLQKIYDKYGIVFKD